MKATTIQIKSAPVVVAPPSPPAPPAPPAPPPSASSEFEATAAITVFVSVSDFMISGTKIDASAATFEKGTAANLKDGVKVQVKGILTAGVVKASRVRFED